MIKYSILNKSLDIWEAENLTEQEAIKLLISLENRERKKSQDDWQYEFEIREIDAH